MRRILPPPIRGVITFTMILINLGFWGVVFFLNSLAFLVPVPGRGSWTRHRLQGVVESWALGNHAVLRWMIDARWEIEFAGEVSPDESYLVIANHQSWLDIPAVHHALIGHSSFIKFFAKKQVIWVPVIGQAAWMLRFPFMKRHSKEFLRKHPDRRGEDLQTTRASLRDFGESPESVLSYVEGTRFTDAKRLATKSPYKNLLKPKAGGIAYVLGAVGDKLHAIIDVTIAYPPQEGGVFWHFICGRVPWVRIHVRRRPVPEQYSNGARREDAGKRGAFRTWVHEIWTEKDALIDAIRRDEFRSS